MKKYIKAVYGFSTMPKHNPNEEYLARRFAQLMGKELKDLLSEVIFFGSSVRNPIQNTIYEKDIDVLLIFNDLVRVLSNEVIEAYRIITENTASKVSKRLHVSTMKLSAFWEYMQNGDPLAINIVRDGVPLLNNGLVEPFKKLLDHHQISPSQEMVWSYYQRGPMTIWSAKWHVLQATIDLYWAVLDASHAVLLSRNLAPDSPQHASRLLKQHFINKKQFPKQYKNTLEKFYLIHQDIAKRNVKEITGKQYEVYYKEAKGFVKAAEQLIPRKT